MCSSAAKSTDCLVEGLVSGTNIAVHKLQDGSSKASITLDPRNPIPSSGLAGNEAHTDTHSTCIGTGKTLIHGE